MYSTTNIKGYFFTNPNAQSTDKMIQARISESVKTGRKDAEGKDIYEFESWNARFVGNACEKAKNLADKSKITLTAWAARNPYSKEKKRSYPYLLVMDFEVQEQDALGMPEPEMEQGDFAMLEDDGAVLPF